MMQFIFVRHGQSQANAEKKIATASTPLTEKGVNQAKKIGQELRDLKIDTIVSSPMRRARQTAQIIAREIGVDPSQTQVIDELHERGLGKLEGGPKTHDSKWYLHTDKADGMEPRGALVKRMKKALNKITSFEKKSQKVLVVGHDVSGNYLIQVAKGKQRFADFESLEPLPHEDFTEVKIK